MNWLRRLWKSLNRRVDDTPVLDYVPVAATQTMTQRKLRKLREQAEKRHGKKFHADTHKPREAPPSDALKKLQEMNKPQQTIITDANVMALTKRKA